MYNFANLSDHVCSLKYILKYIGYNPKYNIGTNNTLYNISFENHPLKYNSIIRIMNPLCDVSNQISSYSFSSYSFNNRRFNREIDISIF